MCLEGIRTKERLSEGTPTPPWHRSSGESARPISRADDTLFDKVQAPASWRGGVFLTGKAPVCACRSGAPPTEETPVANRDGLPHHLHGPGSDATPLLALGSQGSGTAPRGSIGSP